MKKGFSLAEVLITLGVVGIVAALTMPTLIANYQRKVLKTQFAKQYNILLQSFKLVENNIGYKPRCYLWKDSPYSGVGGGSMCAAYNDLGECTRWSYKDGNPLPSDYNGNSSGCTQFKNEMKSVLRIAQVCTNNAYSKGCIPSYNGLDTIKRTANSEISDYDLTKETTGSRNWRKEKIATTSEAWVLPDGAIILFYSNNFQRFAIDVNGKKGPNKWGYDLFSLRTVSNINEPLDVKEDSSALVEPGGTRTVYMIRDLFTKK